MIVGDEHPDHRASSWPAGTSAATRPAARSGKLALTWVPSPGALSMVSRAAEFGDPVVHRAQAEAAGVRAPVGHVEAVAVVGDLKLNLPVGDLEPDRDLSRGRRAWRRSRPPPA